MKALTLWEPWATLVAIGAKTIETRSWGTKFRGPLAIHAAKSSPTNLDAYHDLMQKRITVEAFEKANAEHIRLGKGRRLCDGYAWPCQGGVIVATCELVDVRPTEDFLTGVLPYPSAEDLAFGDFGPGRFGWVLKNVVRLNPQIAAKGKQGLWEFPWPVEVHA